MNPKFVEIEHKYLVGPDFDLADFRARAQSMAPERITELVVTDTYHVVASLPGHVIRHRIDNELQQLTIKSSGSGNELRTEINLELDLGVGNQAAAVQAFLSPMGLLWSGTIKKQILVFYFSSCEVVHYQATSGAGLIHCCVEFEAKNPTSLQQGLSVIAEFEKSFGFSSQNRCHESLFELMFGGDLTPDLRQVLFPGG